MSEDDRKSTQNIAEGKKTLEQFRKLNELPTNGAKVQAEISKSEQKISPRSPGRLDSPDDRAEEIRIRRENVANVLDLFDQAAPAPTTLQKVKQKALKAVQGLGNLVSPRSSGSSQQTPKSPQKKDQGRGGRG